MGRRGTRLVVLDASVSEVRVYLDDPNTRDDQIRVYLDDPNTRDDRMRVYLDDPDAWDDQIRVYLDDPNARDDQIRVYLDDPNAWDDRMRVYLDDPDAWDDRIRVYLDDPDARDDQIRVCLDDPNARDDQIRDYLDDPDAWADQIRVHLDDPDAWDVRMRATSATLVGRRGAEVPLALRVRRPSARGVPRRTSSDAGVIAHGHLVLGGALFLVRERAVPGLQRRRSHTSVIEKDLLGASPLQEPSPLVQRRHAARVVLAEEAVAIAGERTVEKVEHGERDPAEHDGGPEEPRPDRAAGGAVGQQVLGGRSRVGEEIDAVDGVRVSSVPVQRLLREGALEVREVEETMGVMVENEGDDPIADDAHAVDEDDVGADGGNRWSVHVFCLRAFVAEDNGGRGAWPRDVGGVWARQNRAQVLRTSLRATRCR